MTQQDVIKAIYTDIRLALDIQAIKEHNVKGNAPHYSNAWWRCSRPSWTRQLALRYDIN